GYHRCQQRGLPRRRKVASPPLPEPEQKGSNASSPVRRMNSCLAEERGFRSGTVHPAISSQLPIEVDGQPSIGGEIEAGKAPVLGDQSRGIEATPEVRTLGGADEPGNGNKVVLAGSADRIAFGRDGHPGDDVRRTARASRWI